MAEFLFKSETYDLIGLAMEVHNELDPGFLEAVYQEALELEFNERKILYVREKPLNIFYKGRQLNKEYSADFVCYDKIIVELKALSELTNVHDSQLINYLKATKLRVGVLINFGAPSLEFKRLVF